MSDRKGPMQTVNFRLTVSDLVDARAYAYNSLPIVRAVRLIPFVIALGCLPLAAYRAFHQDWHGVSDMGFWLAFGLVLIFWTYVGNRWLLPRSARKQLARSKGLQAEQTVCWDADRVTFDSLHGQSRWPWADLHRWQESSGGFLLWQGGQIYHYLPKRVLADDQVADIRASLTLGVGQPGRRRT